MRSSLPALNWTHTNPHRMTHELSYNRDKVEASYLLRILHGHSLGCYNHVHQIQILPSTRESVRESNRGQGDMN